MIHVHPCVLEGYMHRFDNHKVAAEPAEFQRQESNSIYDSAMDSVSITFTKARPLSLDDLEKRANKYYKINSFSFGQVVPVNNFDKTGVQFFPDGREHEGANEGFDFAAGEYPASDFPTPQNFKSLENRKSPHKQDLQSTTTGTV